MPKTERVTVTLPTEVLQWVDRLARNRSRFIADAVERELARRRREGLLRSIASPHRETSELETFGLADWNDNLPGDDAGLVDESSGTPVRWVEGEGWVETGG